MTPSSAKAIIDYASSAGIEVVVDSKNTDYSVFRGSTCVTPNLIESQLASGESDPNEAARKLHSQTNAMVLVTMGAEGMMLFDGANFITLDAASQEVFDVTGAGDTVAAAIAVRLAEGADIHSAVSWANRAAAVAVSHRGTYAVLRSEVPDALIGADSPRANRCLEDRGLLWFTRRPPKSGRLASISRMVLAARCSG